VATTEAAPAEQAAPADNGDTQTPKVAEEGETTPAA
jgi:hypothetical protein